MAPGASVAVIGAGMAGITCARLLTNAGCGVILLDKARGPSGRLATRRREAARWQWDHGTPGFVARSPAFSAACARWASAGLLAPWRGRWVSGRAPDWTLIEGAATRWVGVPRMSTIARALITGLTLRSTVRIARATHTATGWFLKDAGGARIGPFDALVVAVPAPQAVPLLVSIPTLATAAAQARLAPMHALMLGFEAPLQRPFDAVIGQREPLSLLLRNGAKPQRPSAETWIAHTTTAFSQAHLETPVEQLTAPLVDAFRDRLEIDARPSVALVHRWRYARAIQAAPWPARCAWRPEARVGVCGDWCVPDPSLEGVEAAWHSGAALARAMIGPGAPPANG